MNLIPEHPKPVPRSGVRTGSGFSSANANAILSCLRGASTWPG